MAADRILALQPHRPVHPSALFSSLRINSRLITGIPPAEARLFHFDHYDYQSLFLDANKTVHLLTRDVNATVLFDDHVLFAVPFMNIKVTCAKNGSCRMGTAISTMGRRNSRHARI